MYYIGQKVVCINDKKVGYEMGTLKEDCIYTIKGFNDFDDGLIITETKSGGRFGAYKRERFIPLKDYAESQEAVEELFKELELQAI